MRGRALIPAIGLAIIAAGCGGTSSDAPPTASPATTSTEEGSTTVVMGDYSYAPSPLTVQVGQKVTFVNRGVIDHTIADTDAAGEIRSTRIKPRPIAPQETQVVAFDTPGTVDYICTYHPTLMSGKIIVRA